MSVTSSILSEAYHTLSSAIHASASLIGPLFFLLVFYRPLRLLFGKTFRRLSSSIVPYLLLLRVQSHRGYSSCIRLLSSICRHICEFFSCILGVLSAYTIGHKLGIFLRPSMLLGYFPNIHGKNGFLPILLAYAPPCTWIDYINFSQGVGGASQEGTRRLAVLGKILDGCRPPAMISFKSIQVCAYAIIGLLFFPLLGFSMSFNDATFYYAQGSKFQPDTTQQTAVATTISNTEKARVSSCMWTEFGTSGCMGAKTMALPTMSGPDNVYQDYIRATVVSTSAYHTWSVGPLEPSGTSTTENENDKNTLQSYGDTSYACQNLWLDKSGKMNCAQNWPPPIRTDYATMSAESVTGLRTHTYWIKCDGSWVYSHRYYQGCYGPASWYPQVTVTTAAPGGFASPADYQGTMDYRAELLAAISSITASGFGATTSGVSVTNMQNYYTYFTDGYPIVSSGTTGGGGGTGTTAGSSSGTFTGTINGTANFNMSFSTNATDAEWIAWSDTGAVQGIIEDWVTASTTTGNLKPMFDFINQINFDVSGYAVCPSSWSINCGIFGTHIIDLRDGAWAAKYDLAIAVLKWFLKFATVLTIFAIIL